MNKNKILFYGPEGRYGCFSNFSDHPIRLLHKDWPTVEHFFQAQKFAGTPYEEVIRRASSPFDAKGLGKTREQLIREDWESVKEMIMFQGVLDKFYFHGDIRTILEDTEDSVIIEDSPTDYYWGIGKNGTGKNRLGVILMTVRSWLDKTMS